MALGDFYPSGSVLWDDKVTNTPRAVPANQKVTAVELNNLRDALYDVRTGISGISASMPKLGGPNLGSIKGFWFGSTAPPDATWLWIVMPATGAVTFTPAAGALGIAGQSASVVSLGYQQISASGSFGIVGQSPAAIALAYQQVQLAAASLGFSSSAPTVQSLSQASAVAASAVALGIAGQTTIVNVGQSFAAPYASIALSGVTATAVAQQPATGTIITLTPAAAVLAFSATAATAVAQTPPASIYDSFDRANANDLGPGYAALTGCYMMWIRSNQARNDITDNGYSTVRHTASRAANQYGEVLMATISNADVAGTTQVGIGPVLRISPSGTTYYMVLANTFTSYDRVRLIKSVGGVLTNLNTWNTTAGALAGLVLRAEASGSTITVKTAPTHGGVYTTIINVTNATQTADGLDTGNVGITTGYTGQDGIVDNFYAGDL